MAMINRDRFVAAKELLVDVLPLVKAAELPSGWKGIWCGNCRAEEYLFDDEICLRINELAWSNCAWSNCAACALEW